MKPYFLAAAALCALAALPAKAQSIDTDPDYALDGDGGDWTVQLGALGLTRPDYPGSGTLQGMAVPYIEIAYKDRYFLDPIRGAGVRVLGESRAGTNLTAGLTWAFGRDEDDAAALQGLGDIDGGAALRVAGQVRLGYFNVGGNVVHQVTGDDTGTELTLNATTRLEPVEGFRIFPSVNGKFGDDARRQAFFGVTPDQAAASIFPAYEVDAGLTSWGGQLLGLYDLSEDFYAIGLVSYDRLTGDVADSPIVEDENQTLFALGLVKVF